VKRDVDEAPPGVKIPVVKAAPALAVKMPAKATGKRVVVRKPVGRRVTPGAATPLEETLEILGASTLTIDEGREVINDSAVRKPVVNRKKGAGGRLSRLLNRLGGG
jgi:hypothetical protein